MLVPSGHRSILRGQAVGGAGGAPQIPPPPSAAGGGGLLHPALRREGVCAGCPCTSQCGCLAVCVFVLHVAVPYSRMPLFIIVLHHNWFICLVVPEPIIYVIAYIRDHQNCWFFLPSLYPGDRRGDSLANQWD